MKSLVMKHAWVLFRAGTQSFGECLKESWAAKQPTGLSLRSEGGEKVTVYLGGVWLCSCWGNDKPAVIAGVVELGRVAVGVNKLRLRIAYRMLVPKNPLANLI